MYQSEGIVVSEMTWSLVSVVVVTLHPCMVSSVNWLEWWTYDGISGPSFWGLINPEWSLCNQGLRQINSSKMNFLMILFQAKSN